MFCIKEKVKSFDVFCSKKGPVKVTSRVTQRILNYATSKICNLKCIKEAFKQEVNIS